jgi:hypothetical protein
LARRSLVWWSRDGSCIKLRLEERITMLDFDGKEITPGCRLAYPVRRGSDMWLRSLRVSHVETIRSEPPIFYIVGTNDTGRTVKLEHSERCIVLGDKQ